MFTIRNVLLCGMLAGMILGTSVVAAAGPTQDKASVQQVQRRSARGGGALPGARAAVFRAAYDPWVSKKTRSRSTRVLEGTMLNAAIANASEDTIRRLDTYRTTGHPLKFVSSSFDGKARKASVGLEVAGCRVTLSVPFGKARPLADQYFNAPRDAR